MDGVLDREKPMVLEMPSRELLDDASRRSQRVSAVVALAEEEVARHDKEVSLAKGRLSLRDEVTAFLEEAQETYHRQTVGRYEKLLTGIVRDVFPESEDTVKIDVSSKRGLTSVEFAILNKDGEPEDVMNGRGGSIANILSIGLRFIALSQTSLRRFIVLDEAECWLSSTRVPALSRVIHLLADQIGVQVLVISHNNPDFFRQHSLMVQLKREGDSVVAEPETVVNWAPEQEGIRGIYLNDVMSHHKSFIPLSPGVTTLVGDNDIGKSAVVTAIRAFYGGGTDSMIRHGAPKATVGLDLGSEGTLIWERSRKGAKKTRYALTGGAVEHETLDAAVPRWVEDLGFKMEDDLDIQIGHQKRPVFLLDVPDTKRAAILSIGKESSWLMKMRSDYNDELRSDRQRVKEGEARIAQLTPRIKLSGRASLAEDELARAAKTYQSLSQEAERFNSVKRSSGQFMALSSLVTLPVCGGVAAVEVDDVSSHRRKVAAFSESAAIILKGKLVDAVLPIDIDLPAFVQVKRQVALLSKENQIVKQAPVDSVPEPSLDYTVGDLRRRTKSLASFANLSALKSVEGCDEIAVNLNDVRDLESKIAALHKTTAAATLAPVEAIDSAEFEDSALLAGHIKSLRSLAVQLDEVTKEFLQLERQSAAALTEMQALIDDNGGSCPTCDKAWTLNSNGEHTHD